MKKNTSKSASSLDNATLEQNALAHFSAGRYKEATELFKDLVKHGSSSYRSHLAQCYLQRSLAMSNKGMLKEAVVLWENYAEWAEPPLETIDTYIFWLLAAKNTQKAYEKLATLTAQQLDNEYPECAIWLGFLMLSGHTEIARHLPRDSALISHFAWVQQALEAYLNRRFDDMELALQKLPFRSAFRDFRSLLKAQSCIETSLEQAQTLLRKIPEQSAYKQIANAVLAYTLSGSDFVDTMTTLESSQRRIIAKARGLSKPQCDLLESLCKPHLQQNDKTYFNLAIQYRALFGDDLARDYCQSLLITYPDGRKDYLKIFTGHNAFKKDTFEEHRIQALLSEKSKQIDEAFFHWRRCVDILKRQGPENNKKIALILRHLSRHEPPKQKTAIIAESLEYDPLDKQSHLQLVEYFAQQPSESENYQRWLETSLERFPNDVDFLMKAAQAAVNKQAFKKAVGYAQSLLKIDPVNTFAKQLMFNSHLAHVRRLIKGEKFHLVGKELAAAEQLMVDKSLRLQAELLAGFHTWLGEDKKLGLQRIVETLQKLNPDPINAQFQAFIETALLDAPLASITRALPAYKDHILTEPQLMRLMDLIKYYEEQVHDMQLLFRAVDKLKATLKKSIQQVSFSEEMLLNWCQILERLGHYELLKHCAKLASGKWRKAVWPYYTILAECKGDAGNLGMLTSFRLQHLFIEANQQGDQKTALLISNLIDSHLGYKSPFGGYDFEDDDYYEEDYDEDNVFMPLFAHIPESIMAKIMQKVSSIATKWSPERLINNMMAKRQDVKRIQKFKSDPDFLTSLLILKTAEELGIDIGVDLDDVLDECDNHQPPAFPFF